MTPNRVRATTGILLLGLAVALVPATAASASKHKTTHHKAKKKTAKKKSDSNVSSLGCPNQSLITSSSGTTFTGPSANNGGTAACIYADATGDDLNVVFDMPSESRSKFISTDPSNIGEPAQAVSGIGSAAFSTTAYGHAEVDVYESSAKGFAVTFEPANGGSVTAADLTQVTAVARAIASGKKS
ncbi:MAG TPA: hypothetical protein VGG38_21100 [Acidimicrobiales bacterium]